jgi:hypothetical protein
MFRLTPLGSGLVLVFQICAERISRVAYLAWRLSVAMHQWIEGTGLDVYR